MVKQVETCMPSIPSFEEQHSWLEMLREGKPIGCLNYQRLVWWYGIPHGLRKCECVVNWWMMRVCNTCSRVVGEIKLDQVGSKWIRVDQSGIKMDQQTR